MNHEYKQVGLMAVLALVTSISVCPWEQTLAAGNQTVSNTALPQNEKVLTGDVNFSTNPTNNTLNINQKDQNAVIKWQGGFNIGANATVNFTSNQNNFNTLNYDSSGQMSQIYGKLNAQNGNIYVVNPSGVQIGNSAQINVGSLTVSNQTITDENLNSFDAANNVITGNQNINNAELMSLGHISANTVTFIGERVVIDTDRLAGTTDTGTINLNVVSHEDTIDPTVDKNKGAFDIVLGQSQGTTNDKLTVTLTGVGLTPSDITKERYSDYTYTWIKNGSDLQSINNDLSGHYALRNGIDLTGAVFTPIGTKGNEFKGKLDGLGFSIFGLQLDTIKGQNADAGTGLFGYTNGAIMGYFNLISGTTDTDIKGGKYTGALIGHAVNTKVKGVKTTLDVTGTSNVGGLVGYAEDSTFMNVVNTGVIEGHDNVGGILGVMARGQLGIGETQDSGDGETHNLGKVAGVDASGKNDPKSYNIGGLVGRASAYGENDKGKQDDQQQPVLPKIGGIADFTIDTRTNKLPDVTNKAIYNSANVTGGYNVGGAIGSATGALVGNVINNGAVTAIGAMEDTYQYHTERDNEAGSGKTGVQIAEKVVRAGNAGGIAGNVVSSTFLNVTNTGNVQAQVITNNPDAKGTEFYGAGNIGGIVGRAENSDIITAVNKENHVNGAHNVGGIAGYFGNTDSNRHVIYNSQNNGGDILGTGALAYNDLSSVTEHYRNDENGDTATSPFNFYVGNVGGVAGLLYGDNVHVDISGNRGTVHSKEIVDGNNVPLSSKASNVGGVVGKIDTAVDFTKNENQDKRDNIESEKTYRDAFVSNSYNTGDVQGYTGVGGVVGFMYNGAVAGSYNLGNIRTTKTGSTGTDAVNMGGIVGDTQEQMTSNAFIYDVYNKGTIGYKNEDYKYAARHVGGIVGRLAGVLEKANNAGEIYNGYTVTGGLVGYWNKGDIKNSFNTGNVTVKNKGDSGSSFVGGLVGSASYLKADDTLHLENAYNLGAIRVFGGQYQSMGGIIGGAVSKPDNTSKIDIRNVYTTGNLYADGVSPKIGSIYGPADGSTISAENVYYIKPKDNTIFATITLNDNSNKAIAYGDQLKSDSYQYTDSSGNHSLSSSWDLTGDWRMYDGKTTPILNAFKPYALKPWEGNPNADKAQPPAIKDVISGLKDEAYSDPNVIQFGTAYNPLLTIIHTDKNNVVDANKGITINGFIVAPDTNSPQSFDKIHMWQTMGIRDSFAVYGDTKTTVNGFDLSRLGEVGTMENLHSQVGNYNVLYSGTIYTDGDLTIKNYGTLGNASAIYGKNIIITGEPGSGDFSLNGTIRATNGNVTITNDGGSVSTYGSISSSKDGDTFVGEGLGDTNSEADLTYDETTVKDASQDVENVAKQYQFKDKTDANDTIHGVITAGQTPGKVAITADGDVNLLYGNNREGIITAVGGLTIASKAGNIFIDGAINAGTAKDDKANITLTGSQEMVLDISNIGKDGAGDVSETSNKKLHDFLDNTIVNFDGDGASDGKIAMDMSEETGTGFDFNKYDKTNDKLSSHLQSFSNKIQANGKADGGQTKYVYTWLKNADQLNAIQQYKDDHSSSQILTYNFALKNDIDASTIGNYNTIDTYSGTLDGRTYRISGLNATEGIFRTLDTEGVVKNLKVYSSKITGDAAGSGGVIAKTNNGTLDNVKGLGNTVAGSGTIGGLVADNQGTIQNSEDSSSIIGSRTATVGGLAGTNTGKIIDSMTDSAITGAGSAMGGIVGKNDTGGIVYDVSSHGVSGKVGSTNIGGIVGQNSSAGGKLTINGKDTDVKGITDAYNDSVIVGTTTLGGVAGTNGNGASLEYVANGSTIDGQDDGNTQSTAIGGLIGKNSGTVDGGRNTGTITGNINVGGLVGLNDKTSILTNLENGPSATITGETNVGGIAGRNDGTITADENNKLVNEGTVTGQTYVGGVAGLNNGTITNTNSAVTLKVKEDINNTAKYFGGVAGKNASTGIIKNATNTQDIIQEKADYLGGIAGWNDGSLQGASNSGNVTGKSFVGGVAGLNTRNLQGYTDANDTKQEDILIQNSGNVTAKNGGAGGIFGENQGNIGDTKGNKHIILSNTGNVTGNNEIVDSQGTGGVIGVNKGNISHTSLRNEVKWDAATNSYTAGTVSGTNNVGGVIGLNYGTVTGGRNEKVEDKRDFQNYEVKAEANSYYEYQILNNGNVTADSNAGGLIGKNMSGDTQVYDKNNGAADENNAVTKKLSGTIIAGYNTGNVTGQTAVGGIVGTNAQGATVDQVFSTLAEGNKVGGNSAKEVGGVVGNNAGTLTNAYATDTITGGGNVVGTNTGTIENIYSQSTTGNLINTNNGTVTNAYSFNENDTSTNNKLEGDAQKKQDSYNGFDFDKKAGSTTIDNTAKWKLYDGNSNPLLKVFLNKVTVNADGQGTDGRYHVTYNGTKYSADTLKDKLTAANGKNFAEDNNTKGTLLGTKGNIFHADDYNDVFYSQQINTKGDDKNPNNLGYDVDVNVTVDKRTVYVSNDDINRTYGNTTINNGKTYENFSHYVIDAAQGEDTSKMDEQLKGNITFTQQDDGALKNGTQTNDVGAYTWSTMASLNTQNDDKTGYQSGDYDIKYKNKDTNVTDKAVANSTVDKAQLIIKVNDVTTTYGTQFDKNKYGYTFGQNGGLVNGDKTDALKTVDEKGNEGTTDVLSKVQYQNDAAKDGINDVWTDNVGTYAINMLDGDTLKTLKNYDVKIQKGTATVTQAKLTIGVADTTIMKGETPNYHGTGIKGLTNGDDKHLSPHYGIADSSQEDIVGVHSGIIGLIRNDNQFIGLGNTKDNINALAKYLDINAGNYIFDLTPGTLTVKDIYEPTTPDSHWDWLYKDYPWDKIKNFRERRAELHYVDGGVFIEQ